MELHTLGVDGGYTQTDVIEVARALTGWTIDPRARSLRLPPARARRRREDRARARRCAPAAGIEDGEQVLDMLARHPSTARYITKKLVVRFVSDSAPPALVDRCAADFRRTDGDIRADAAVHRDIAGVLLPSGVSQQGEDAVRARRERAARDQCDAGSRAAKRSGGRAARAADLRPSDA